MGTNIESHAFNTLSTNVLNDTAIPFTFASGTTSGRCDVASMSYIPSLCAKQPSSSMSSRNILESMF